MPHVVQPAATGRSKCRGCGLKIERGELRFGESRPNPYGEGDTTSWFHVRCGAYKRPEPFLEWLESEAEPPKAGSELEGEARLGVEHHRLDRIAGAERAPSGRARCRACRERIEKSSWRFSLSFHAEGRFEPGGFVHLSCAPSYFETADLVDRAKQLSADLREEDVADLAEALREAAARAEPDP